MAGRQDMDLQKVRLQGQWVDVVFIHALACACNVDAVIYSDETLTLQTLVGRSLHEQDEVAGVIPLVMKSRYHCWPVLPPDMLPNESVTVHVSATELPDENNSDCEELLAEKATELAKPLALQEEIKVCECISKWDPWKLPSAELVEALQTLGVFITHC